MSALDSLGAASVIARTAAQVSGESPVLAGASSPASSAPVPAAEAAAVAEAGDAVSRPAGVPAPNRPAVPSRIVAANLALTCLCAFAIAVVLALSVGPRFFAYETFIVRSGSMAPAITTGSLVVVQPVQPREIVAGDVITYRRPEEPETAITHRVIEVRAPSADTGTGYVFRTKGDANAASDPWEIQIQGIAWRVIFSVPVAGHLFAFTQQPAGRALFLILPGLGLGVLWLHRTWLVLRRPQAR